MAFWVAAAENDNHGNPTGFAENIHIGVNHQYLELEGPRVAVSGKVLTLRVGTVKIPIIGYHPWYGNMAWNAWPTHSVHALKVVNYLLSRKFRWQCIGGPSVLFRAVNDRRVITPEEWKGAF